MSTDWCLSIMVLGGCAAVHKSGMRYVSFTGDMFPSSHFHPNRSATSSSSLKS